MAEMHIDTIGKRTMTGATDTDTLTAIRGKIKAIAIHTSASNTFHIHSTGGMVAQDVYGSAVSPITITADTVIYPRVKIKEVDGTDGAAGDNLWAELCVEGNLQIDVASGTAADTWGVTVFYEN